MANWEKILQRVLSGTADAGIRFRDLTNLLKRLGFQERIQGDHHIFSREDLEPILNLQPKNGMAKPYQVRQVRTLILEHSLYPHEDEADADHEV